MRFCFYCKSQPSTSKRCGRDVCNLPECLDKSHIYNRRHYYKLKDLDPSYDDRKCLNCGRPLRGTKRHEFCALSKCQLVRKQKIRAQYKKYIDELSPKLIKPEKKYYCQWPKCSKLITNGNRIHCQKHAHLIYKIYDESAIGFGSWEG
jgi:hypothetical protein